MNIDVSVEIPFSRAEVYAAYRDKLPELVPYLHNVRAIEVKSREVDGSVTKFLNRWKGGGEIPAVVRKILSAEMLEWDDYATWDESRFSCDWKTVVPAFKDAVDAHGHTDYIERGPAACTVKIVGVLNFDAKKVSFIPRLLAGTVGPAIETFLVAAIKPNLVSVAKGVEKYLQALKR